jgi:Fur family transcriptional regulator, ferric uptake regulator
MMNDKLLEAAKKKLQAGGYKLTAPRLAILGYLIREKGHPGMQEIHEGIKADCPGIGIATVYRTVDLLLEIGVLRAITLRNNRLRYEVNWPDDHHHHLVCTGCGRVMEFGSCNFSSIAREIEKVTRYKIEDHALEAYGLCPQCSSSEPGHSMEKM